MMTDKHEQDQKMTGTRAMIIAVSAPICSLHCIKFDDMVTVLNPKMQLFS